MKSLQKNFLYNVLYQILLVILPLITAPYISRTLGATAVGVYSYTYSVAYYFLLIAMLGIGNHGNRSIAAVRDDRKKLNNMSSYDQVGFYNNAEKIINIPMGIITALS